PIGSTEQEQEAAEGEGAAGTKPKDLVAALGQAVRDQKPGGGRTELGAALLGVAREHLGRDDRRLAGVVLLSDGRDNSDAQKPPDAVRSLGKTAEDLRLTAVALGDPKLAKNLWVDRVIAPDVALVQDAVNFVSDLKQTGFDGVPGVEVKLEIEQVAGADGKKLATPRRYDED